MAGSHLPPELVERMNRPSKSKFASGSYETSSGGFMPYSSVTRRSQSLGATAYSTNPSVAHVSETSHWLTRNQVSKANSMHFSGEICAHARTKKMCQELVTISGELFIFTIGKECFRFNRFLLLCPYARPKYSINSVAWFNRKRANLIPRCTNKTWPPKVY